MKVVETELAGVLLIEPRVFGDPRGFFMETYHEARYADAGIPGPFVQDNLSFSQKGVLRGLHFQNPQPQGKLVYVLQGSVFDVVVDVRVGSPNFGRWLGVTLSAEDKRQLWVPEGFAHGFCVTSDTALFGYKCTALYAPNYERSLLWNDPALGVEWPVEIPSLSQKDGNALRLADMPRELLPVIQCVRDMFLPCHDVTQPLRANVTYGVQVYRRPSENRVHFRSKDGFRLSPE